MMNGRSVEFSRVDKVGGGGEAVTLTQTLSENRKKKKKFSPHSWSPGQNLNKELLKRETGNIRTETRGVSEKPKYCISEIENA
jgi:hypothetical protein